MATYDDLRAACEACGLRYARIQFDPHDDKKPMPPFVILMPRTTRNQHASNRTVARLFPYDVELYTDGSDLASETALMDALDAHGFAYERRTVPLGDGIVETVLSTFCSSEESEA